jgi:hypothetical protein
MMQMGRNAVDVIDGALLQIRALAKAKGITCSSLPLFPHHHILVASDLTNGSVDCSSFINAPYEYFDPSGSLIVNTYVVAVRVLFHSRSPVASFLDTWCKPVRQSGDRTV